MRIDNSITFVDRQIESKTHKRSRNEDLAGVLLAESYPRHTSPLNAALFYVCDGVGSSYGYEAVEKIQIKIQQGASTLLGMRYELFEEAKIHKSNIDEIIFKILKAIIHDLDHDLRYTMVDGVETEVPYEDTPCATISMAFVFNGSVYSCNLGDSPMYLLELDEDESVISDLIELYQQQNEAASLSKMEALSSPSASQLSNGVLGDDPEDDSIFTKVTSLPPSSLLLMGSDGGLSIMTDSELISLVNSYAGQPVSRLVNALYSEISDSNFFTDNFTVIAQQITCQRVEIDIEKENDYGI